MAVSTVAVEVGSTSFFTEYARATRAVISRTADTITGASFLQTSKSFLLRCNMEIYSQLLLIYLVLINLVSIIVTISDKVKAIKRKWRIPESTLLLLSALGGSVSMYITMLIIRHKTKHPKFMIGIPVIFALQCILVFLIWRYIYV